MGRKWILLPLLIVVIASPVTLHGSSDAINLRPDQTFDSTLGAAPGESANWTLAAPSGWKIANSNFSVNPDAAVWTAVANAADTTPHKYKEIPGPNTPARNLDSQVKGTLKPPQNPGGGGAGQPPKLDFTANLKVENVQAQGMAITTIQDNPNWPGARPDGLEGRLGYAAGANPSDDQIVFDVIMNIPGGIVTQLNSVFGSPIHTPAQGQLTNATGDDKQWITLAMLKRSTNGGPAANISDQDLITVKEGGD
jgi:hypothetical protein